MLKTSESSNYASPTTSNNVASVDANAKEPVKIIPASSNVGTISYAQSSFSTCNNQQESLNQRQLQPNIQYLTIVQDPYPPLNNSPEFYDSNRINEQMSSFINCIDMSDLNEAFQNPLSDIKREQDLFN